MIDTELAQQLKQAGLKWRPVERDFFAIPDHNLDGQIFVVSQLPALLQVLGGEPTITFHGSIEWALDYILLVDVVWLPTETQLREALVGLLGDTAQLWLERLPGGYRCQIVYAGEARTFDTASAERAYAEALLAVLRHQGA